MTTGRLEKLCSGGAESIELANAVNRITNNDCEIFKSFAMFPWSWLIDFSMLLPQIRVVERREISLPLLRQQLNLDNDDIYLMTEKAKYDWNLDDNPSNNSNGKYRRTFTL